MNEVDDDRDTIRPGDRVLMIVENDLAFARIVLDAARERGFKGVVTSFGATALALAQQYRPAAITLDIFLADIEGWRVLLKLKNELATRHIPVCVISTEDVGDRASVLGAYTVIPKPLPSQAALERFLDDLMRYVSTNTRGVLLVEGRAVGKDSMRPLLAGGADVIALTVAGSGKAAAALLRERRFDCIVVDERTPCPTRAALIAELEASSGGMPVPVIVRCGAGTQIEAWTRLGRANKWVRQVQSDDRLIDQVSLALHRRIDDLPAADQEALRGIYELDTPLTGRKVLIVDDDVRNIYALSSVLEDRGMTIVSAENGLSAIRTLQDNVDIDLVLMDIMMPEMDGIDTMREIRKITACKDLPIIAVTAKAMKGDRERCIEAGAWDYLSKPVDTDQMLSVLRAWMHR